MKEKTAKSLLDIANRAYAAGQLQTSLDNVALALEANPRNSDALHLRGLIALALNKPAEAQVWVTRAVQILPHPFYCNCLCVAYNRTHAYEAAANSARLGLRRARERFPTFDTALLWYNLGVALHSGGDLSGAAEAYSEMLARQPNHGAALNNLGTIRKELGDLAAAISLFEQAVALDPQNRNAQSNLGHSLLAAGRYDEGWPFFEQRWASLELVSRGAPKLPIPLWSGGVLPHARRLLVLHEQGAGDALQFCRYLPLALAHSTRVGYVCPAPLRRLFEQSLCTRWPNLVLVDEMSEEGLSNWDAYCSLLSLPMLLGTRFEAIPASIPYIYADPLRAHYWVQRLARLGADSLPRIGLVWAGGNAGSAADSRRSIATEQFLDEFLSWSGAHWVSLQKSTDSARQLPYAYTDRIVDWMGEINDYAETAALIDGLDLVISVDTSVAHLAAAMGKPVWLLNRFAGCWRWLRDRDDSPWYPGLRLFNQRTRGQWGEVFARVHRELEATYFRRTDDRSVIGPAI